MISQPDSIPFILPDLDIILKEDGQVFINTKSGFYKIEGLTHQKCAWIIAHVDGKHTIAELLEVPDSILDESNVDMLFEGLHGKLIGFKDNHHDRLRKKIHLSPASASLQDHFAEIKSASEKSDFANIGILGGGTAGYLTALALKKKSPSCKITLIESSSIPVIGVEEATTPLIIDFLHRDLQLDIVEFYNAVRPTWKLGIKFLWGNPAPYSFINPFGTGDLLISELDEGHLNNATLESVLIQHEKGIFTREYGKETPRSLMNRVGYAYHLDNKLFLSYLKQKILAAGIIIQDRQVKAVNLKAETGDVDSMITKDGEKLTFDLYVDCSGFRSMLLGHALQSRFISFSSSLITDAAVIGTLKNPDGPIPPYTLAETMDHGWNWKIPLQDQHHRGYVFSSSFCSEDQVWEEMKRIDPNIENPSTVKFTSGKRESFWLKNVIGIGNSYGFVEPLESTGIHMIIEEIRMLTENFFIRKSNQTIKKLINEKISHQWDYLRWYLALHYKFNHRLQTTFWQTCQKETNISGVHELVDLFQEEGPLYLRSGISPHLMRSFFRDQVFGPFGFDYILMGQKVPFQAKHLPNSTAQQWGEKKSVQVNIANQALDQRSALEHILKNNKLVQH
ncbi:MAG: tryptophan 7-halogenase [Saprospiraceae bacterium]|nr:tryptophan 7-halogenase [Saprospiraceae bacterium]